MEKFKTEGGVEFTVRPAVGRKALLPMQLLGSLGISFDKADKDNENTMVQQFLAGISKLSEEETNKFFDKFEGLLNHCAPEGVEKLKVNNELNLSMMTIFNVIVAAFGSGDDKKEEEEPDKKKSEQPVLEVTTEVSTPNS
jgi:hypothetical protein